MADGWAGSNRRSTMPDGWYGKGGTREQILRRDAYRCVWVDLSTGERCTYVDATRTGHGLQVDHIKPHSLGGGEEHSNLRTLCSPHHAVKSSGEGAKAAAAMRKATRERVNRQFNREERHPGLL